MGAIWVVTELRARGFLANCVSWFVWQRTGGDFAYQDETILGSPQTQLASVLIILVGPCKGVRLSVCSPRFGHGATLRCRGVL